MDDILTQVQLILAQEDLRHKIAEARHMLEGQNELIRKCIETKIRIMQQIEDMEKLL
jgi:hypothetical protein